MSTEPTCILYPYSCHCRAVSHSIRCVPIGRKEIAFTCLEVTCVDPPPKTARVAESAVRPRVEDETKVTQRRIKTLEAELEHVKAAKAGQAKSRSPPNEVESSGLRGLHGISLFADLGIDRVGLTCSSAERGVTR